MTEAPIKPLRDELLLMRRALPEMATELIYAPTSAERNKDQVSMIVAKGPGVVQDELQVGTWVVCGRWAGRDMHWLPPGKQPGEEVEFLRVREGEICGIVEGEVDLPENPWGGHHLESVVR